MTADPKKSRISQVHLDEAARLRAIWDATEHESQAVFGEKYDVGNQSAVGQFLNGKAPLSLKAAAGFARGLGRPVADFSTRLATKMTVFAAASERLDHGTGERAGRYESATLAKDVLVVPLLANSGSMGPGADQGHDDVVIGRLTLSPSWVDKTIDPLSSPTSLRFIHGYGDSMEPTFKDGDVLLVDAGITEAKIDGVYVLEAQNRLFIKRVRQRLDGIFEVSSDNPTVKTIDVLDGRHPVTVLGKVVWLWNGRKL